MWLLILSIIWFVVSLFFLCLFVTAKRADQKAEAMFLDTKRDDEMLNYDEESEMIGKICLT
ncbi:hypothetical protein [Paenibacillus aestuarii]|uniref:Uncharacterized protein n=1 Tax=Paenibacillus aestuarii TaxID=516965 RepID=A0ABW0K041_9BACL|nr:hypothetical protein [Paenibacillus aestuarii]